MQDDGKQQSICVNETSEGGGGGNIFFCVCIYICICICINLYLLMIHIQVTSVICQGGEDGEEKNGLAWSGAEVW